MENLPDDILIEIFKMLPLNSLKNLTSVCQRWSILIANTKTLTKDLQITIKLLSFNPDTCPIQINCDIDIPILGLEYEKLHYQMPRMAIFNYDKKTMIQEIFKKYEAGIKHLTLCRFEHATLHGHKFRNVTHLEIQRGFNSDWLPDFVNLMHLSIEVGNFEDILFLKKSKFNLKHLSVTCTNDYLEDEDIDSLLKFILRHIDTLEELKIVGVPYDEDHYAKLIEILESQRLKSIELNVREITEGKLLLEALKKDRWWRKLHFIDPVKGDEERMQEILNNFQDIKILKISSTDRYSVNTSPLNGIGVGVAIFTFADSSLRDLSFKNVTSLTIARLFNESQSLRLIEKLRQSPNVKILKIKNMSARSCIDSKMKNLLDAVKDLEVLHFEAYSQFFDISLEALKVIRNEGRNIKKFTIVLGEERAVEMREKLRIFERTGVLAVVLVKKIDDTCLEKPPKALREWRAEGIVRFSK